MMKTHLSMNAPALYEIRVFGHLSESWAARFEGITLLQDPDGETVFSGTLDQAALHGVLIRIRNLGLVLISIHRVREEESAGDD